MLPPSNEKLNVLIVEDEPLLAMNLEDLLTELGYHVSAIALKIDKAMQEAGSAEIGLAFLDINLSGSTTFQIAAVLEKRGIPFIFTTGYGADDLIESYRSAHLLAKPFTKKQLENMIAKALAAAAP